MSSLRWLRCLLVESCLVAVASASPAENEVFDGRCWSQTLQADPAACNQEDPCRSDCWSSVFSHSYCCLVQSPCWWWGREVPGDIVRLDFARSGVECRHLCQAEPNCESWSYEIPPPNDPNTFGPCALRSAAAGGKYPGEFAAGVVSGPRICLSRASQELPEKTRNLEDPQGIAGVFSIAEPGWENKVAEAVLGNGWAVLRQALLGPDVEALAAAARRAAAELQKRDPPRLGNRGPRRYSFGGASTTHHMVHEEAWAALLDYDSLHAALSPIFGGEYVAIGGGGDFVLEATDTHQRLHVDLQLAEMYDKDFPPAAVAANVAISSISCEDGPLRLVPHTQRLPLAAAEEALGRDEFPEASSLERESIVRRRLGLTVLVACPLMPGDVLLRDMRLWHGGTPNRGKDARLLPSAEFLAPWYADLAEGTEDHFAPRPALPLSSWWRMSASGRQATRRILAAPAPVAAAVRPDFALLLPYVAEDRP